MVGKKMFQLFFTRRVKWTDFLNDADQPLELVKRLDLEAVLLVAKGAVAQQIVDLLDHGLQFTHMAPQILHEVGHDDLFE